MKRIFTFLTIVFFTVSAFAQSPEKMSYQAVIRNSSNALVTNTQVGMRISFLQSSASGTAVYVETQTPTTNANGLVSVEIGAGTVVSGQFSSIDWANGPYFIKTETDPVGGTSYTITGVSQLMSVPYALYAKNSGSSIPGPQGIQGETGATGPQGLQGETGTDGVDGKSAYELWIGAGNTGTEADFSASLLGKTGATGPQGIQGETGTDGVDGKSAYELWIEAGNTGTEAEFLASLQGEKGATGLQGIQGQTGVTGAKGDTGKSAYELWMEAGNTGTNAEFLASLQGKTGATGPQGIQGETGVTGAKGADGKTAYELWIEAGNTGTNAEFLASLQGEKGATGPMGPQGYPGPMGPEGEMGPAGKDGVGFAQYAYIYNLSAQVVAIEADIIFSNNGIKNEAINHSPGTSTITLFIPGVYMIWFNVAGVEPNQFTLFQNGSAVAGSFYGSGAGTQINSGMVILYAAAGDVITLRNHTSAAAVTLQTLAGGTQLNTNASILIQKIGD